MHPMQMLVADCTPVTKQCNQSKVKRELDETIPVETACSIDSSQIGLSVFEIKRHNTTNVSIQFQSHKHCTNSSPSKRNDCWRIQIRWTAYQYHIQGLKFGMQLYFIIMYIVCEFHLHWSYLAYVNIRYICKRTIQGQQK